MQQLLEQHLREHVLKGEQNFDEEEMQKYLLLLDRYSKWVEHYALLTFDY